MPRATLPSVTRGPAADGKPFPGRFAARLRAGTPPVIGYVSGDRFRLDLRTVFPRQDETLVPRDPRGLPLAVRLLIHATAANSSRAAAALTTRLPGSACSSPFAGGDRSTSACPRATRRIPTGWRQFEITTRVTLPALAGCAQLWLPLAQTAGGYQTALDCAGTAPAARSAFTSPLRRARSCGRPGTTMTTPAATDRSRADRRHARTAPQTPLLPLTEAERQFWTAPTPACPAMASCAKRSRASPPGKTAAARTVARDLRLGRGSHPSRSGHARLRARRYQAMLRTRPTRRQVRRHQRPDGRARPRRRVSRRATCTACASPTRACFPAWGAAAIFPGRNIAARKFSSMDEGWFPVDPADVRKVVLEANSRSTARRCARCGTVCSARGK